MPLFNPRCTLVLLSVLLVSCVTPGPYNPPATGTDKLPVYQSGVMPTPGQRPSAYPVPGTYYGVTSAKSTSFPFALFFGAVGALAGQAVQAGQAMQMMQPATQEITKFDLSAQLTALDVLPKPPGGAAPASHMALTPAAILVFGKDDMLRVACGVYADHTHQGVRRSTRRYFNGEGRPFTAAAATVDALQQELRECLSRAMEMFRWDRAASDPRFAATRVRFFGGAETTEVQAVTAFLPGRLVMPDALGLFQYAADNWAPAGGR